MSFLTIREQEGQTSVFRFGPKVTEQSGGTEKDLETGQRQPENTA